MLSTHQLLLLTFHFLLPCSLIGMDPTTPRFAHPERAQQVEGRRDSNHAIAPGERRRMEQPDLTHRIVMQETAIQKALTTKKSSRSCCCSRLFVTTKITSKDIQKVNPDLHKYLKSDPRTPLHFQKVPVVDQVALKQYLIQRRKELSQVKIKIE